MHSWILHHWLQTTIVALIYFSVVQWVLHIVVLFVQLSHEVVFFPFSLVCRLGKSTSLSAFWRVGDHSTPYGILYHRSHKKAYYLHFCLGFYMHCMSCIRCTATLRPLHLLLIQDKISNRTGVRYCHNLHKKGVLLVSFHDLILLSPDRSYILEWDRHGAGLSHGVEG